jgi:hypothetical protein
MLCTQVVVQGEFFKLFRPFWLVSGKSMSHEPTHDAQQFARPWFRNVAVNLWI